MKAKSWFAVVQFAASVYVYTLADYSNYMFFDENDDCVNILPPNVCEFSVQKEATFASRAATLIHKQ
jgi:hypothetical protein